MTRGKALALVAAAMLPLAACGSGDSDALPPCPKITGSPVTEAGLTGHIAFVTTAIPVPGYYHCSAIFVMNADGSGLRRASPTQTFPFDARPSPDGKEFVFVGTCPDLGHGELCVVNADGTGLRPLTTTSPGHFVPVHDGDPAWSPDGSRIAFSRRQESLGPGDLYIANRDGTGEVRLTSDPGDESDAAWSPDGQTIAYIAKEGTEQLRLIKASGGASTVLAEGGTMNESPAFSHDGRRIAFSSNRGGKPESAYSAEVRKIPGSEDLPSSGAHDIYLIGVDGEGLTRLTSDASANYAPVWSLDDRHIAIVSDRDGSHNLYVMAADGTDVVRMSPFEASSVSWFD